MKEKLLPLLKQADALPFLFVGSGMSKRYLNIPTWFDLVKHIAMKVYQDEFKFESVRRTAAKRFDPNKEYNHYMTTLVDMVSDDLENVWISEERFAENRDKYQDEYLRKGTSPFKIEIADLISKKQDIVESMSEEFEALKSLSEKSISGIITTNYDELMERVFGFEVYESQQELIFHVKYNIGEIYKIHGSVTNPKTIMIDSSDYKEIEEKNKYIAAKLMTIFVEHPIVFMGYSMQDEDIRHILEDIQASLTEKQLKNIAKRMFFVDWNKGVTKAEIGTLVINFSNGRSITVTRIILNDFTELYRVLEKNKAKYPTKILRYMKEDIYKLVLTNDPKDKMLLSLPSEKMTKNEIQNVEFVYGFGVIDLAKRGYSMPTPVEIYRDILLDDAKFNPDTILSRTIPELNRVYGKMPGYKYFKDSNESTRQSILKKHILAEEFDKFKTKSICRRKNSYRSVKEIVANEDSLYRQLQALETLNEDEIVVSDLENYLVKVFEKCPGIFSNADKRYKSTETSSMRRMVRELDFLKYKN